MTEVDISVNSILQSPSIQRPRVLIANATAEIGGAEQVVLALAERLPALGVDVAFALLRPGPLQKIIEDRGMKAYVFGEDFRYRNIGSVRRCIQWLTSCIQEEHADLLHSNLTSHFVGGWAARRAKIPELWHLHDYPFRFDPIHAINRRIPTNFCLFTTTFLKSGEPLLQRRPNAVVNPNCVDVERLLSMASDPGVRDRLGIGRQRFFLTVARFQEHKGHRFLIDAAAAVAKKYPDVSWVIAGQARGEEQNAYLAGLKQKINSIGLEGRVYFPGFVSDVNLLALYREAFSLVHPAVTEGYGLVLIEAMACGLPVIAASAAGPAEIIESERNGLLVPAANSAALADSMVRLLEDSLLVRRIKDQATQDVRNRSVGNMAELTATIYRKMLGHL